MIPAGKSASDSKDALRKKVQHAEANIADLEHTITMLKQDMIENGWVKHKDMFCGVLYKHKDMFCGVLYKQ